MRLPFRRLWDWLSTSERENLIVANKALTTLIESERVLLNRALDRVHVLEQELTAARIVVAQLLEKRIS